MINNHNLYIIVAVDEEMGIGKDGKMPWNFKSELKYFQDVTSKTEDPEKQNMVVMGRTTWESIPKKYRPLKGRKNVVLTRNPEYSAEGADVHHSLDDAVQSADENIENIFVIGGGKVYAEAINHKKLEGIYLTKIHHTFDCDTFFPEIPDAFGEPVSLGGVEEDEIKYNYLFYKRQK